MNILVVAAHPDDEVLGCGGTIACHANAGAEIYIAILGEGITSRYTQPRDTEPIEMKALRDCSCKAASLLGAKKVFHYDFPDNRFDSVNLLDLVKVVETHIDELQPRIIYTHNAGDLNIDHTITLRATLIASRPQMNCPVKEFYSFEIPSSTEWSFGQFKPHFNPNSFVDISNTLDNKINAIQIYEGEIRDYPHPRSPQALKALANKWGSTVGVYAAEAFNLVWQIRSTE